MYAHPSAVIAHSAAPGQAGVEVGDAVGAADRSVLVDPAATVHVATARQVPVGHRQSRTAHTANICYERGGPDYHHTELFLIQVFISVQQLHSYCNSCFCFFLLAFRNILDKIEMKSSFSFFSSTLWRCIFLILLCQRGPEAGNYLWEYLFRSLWPC